MVAQFEHLDETYFSGFDYDLGERELGLVTTVDHELDVFAAALGLTRTSIATITKDDGASHSRSYTLIKSNIPMFSDIVLEMGDLDIESQLFEPLQQLLDQTRSAKVLSRLVYSINNLLDSHL